MCITCCVNVAILDVHVACAYIHLHLHLHVLHLHLRVTANIATSESYLPVLFIIHKHIRSDHPID